MKQLALFLALISFNGAVADVNLRETLSPDGKVGIQGIGSDLFLIDAATNKKLAPLFPPNQQGQISNVSIEVSWSPDSRKVAILASYGNKLEEFLIYSVGKEVVHPIRFDEPDLYKIFKGKLNQGDAGDEENSLDQWTDNNTLLLSYGEADNEGTKHFTAKVQLTVSEKAATSKIIGTGVFSDQAQ